METVKARVVEKEKKHFIEIDTKEPISIPLSDDDPNAVKTSFNRLIERLRNGNFKLELEGVDDKLFSQVANEYIKQLNAEIAEVHGEMVRSALTDG